MKKFKLRSRDLSLRSITCSLTTDIPLSFKEFEMQRVDSNENPNVRMESTMVDQSNMASIRNGPLQIILKNKRCIEFSKITLNPIPRIKVNDRVFREACFGDLIVSHPRWKILACPYHC